MIMIKIKKITINKQPAVAGKEEKLLRKMKSSSHSRHKKRREEVGNKVDSVDHNARRCGRGDRGRK
jgi:hypothetical protein